jgi:glutamine amidotransferase
MMRIALVDYGAGNLRSAGRALRVAGASPVVVTGAAGLAGADAIVVPGVGAFAPAMSRLAAAGLVEPLRAAVRRGVPLVGICLGMQLLFEGSDEGEPTSGLSLLAGRVVRLPVGVKVPHMGWNTLEIRTPDPLFEGLPPLPHVYFVHSYVVEPSDPRIVIADTTYGARFPAVVRQGSIWGLQFHPEKSSRVGAVLLGNLLAQIGALRSPA